MTDDESSLEDFEDHQADDGEEQAENHDVPHPPQPGEDAHLAGSQTPGRGVPELRSSRSEHDRSIRPGTPVRDLWNGSWLLVFRKKADTVTEYDEQQPDTKQSLLSYEGSIGTGATEDDAVWACFYLNANNTLAGGRSGPYDFPESRICRYAYDSTDGFDGGRVQDVVRQNVLEAVVRQFPEFQAREDEAATLFEAISSAFGEEAATEAFELAEADAGDL